MSQRTSVTAQEVHELVLCDGRYEVEAPLGVGGMGAVYRVRDQKTGQRLALKKLSIKDERHARFLISQFEREYHTLRQLAHPCIVEAYEYGLDGHNPYYTMELLQGTDLRAAGQLSWIAARARTRD